MTTQAKIDSTPVSMIAAADLSEKLFRFGKHTANGINVCTVAGERADGIIGAHYKKTPDAGDPIDLYVDRIMIIEAGDAFAAGVDLTTDANGKAVAAGEGDVVNAVSVDAATADTQYVRCRPPYAKTAEAGTVATSAADASVSLGTEVIIAIDIPDAATATYDYTNDDKLEIVEVLVRKDGAGAANTIQLKTAGGVAISDAIAAAVDNALTRSGTIDAGLAVLDAAAGFQITATRAAGTMAARVFIRAIKLAA